MAMLSVRVRLALWSLAIVGFVLLVFSAAVYLSLRHSLNETLNDNVANRAALTQDFVVFDGAGRPSLNLQAREGLDPEDAFERLFDPSGATLFDSSGAFFSSVDSGGPAFERALAGERSRYTAGRGKDEARVVVAPVLRDGVIVGVLQVGASTDDVREPLRTLLLIFAVTMPVGIVIASFGTWWLASRTLSPIDRLTLAAREITAHDLSRRLDLKLPDDEVGRLARTFDDMIGRLDAAFRRQRQFTADASHELRTPLTAIRGQIDVALERSRDPGEYSRVLVAVNEQVDRMTRLVAGMLMLARTDAGTLPLDRARVDVKDLVGSVADQLRTLAAEKGLALTLEPGAAVAISGDEDLLLQLLLNLADNAIKYTPAGGVRLGWRSRGGSVEIFVSDTGPGIAAEHRERVFERFFRVETTRSDASGGIGLGLAISRWIAEAHGGTIILEGSDAGSTFTVSLPAA